MCCSLYRSVGKADTGRVDKKDKKMSLWDITRAMGMTPQRWHDLPLRDIPTHLCIVPPLSDDHQDSEDGYPHIVRYDNDYFVVENDKLFLVAKRRRYNWIQARVITVQRNLPPLQR